MGADGRALDRARSGARGVDGVEEPQHLAGPAAQPDPGGGTPQVRPLHGGIEAERPQRGDQPVGCFRVRRANPQDPIAVAAPRVEASGQEALAPLRAWVVRPAQQPLQGPSLISAGGANRRHPAVRARLRRTRFHAPRLFGEGEVGAADARAGQVIGGPGPRGLARGLGQRQPEQVTAVSGRMAPRVGVVADAAVRADQAAQVAAPVGDGLLRRLGEVAGAHQRVTGRQVRAPPQLAEPGPGHVTPPALGEEPVVAAAYELGTVRQHQAVRGLDRGPVRQHGGANVFAVAAPPDRPVDTVSDPDLGQRFGPAICHQDGRLALESSKHTHVGSRGRG